MVQVLILRAPGTNCNAETQFAFEQAGASCTQVHINQLLEQPAMLDQFQVLCIPGGFSYGDDVGAGRILASQMRRRLRDELQRFRDDDKLMLGICNGFQVLINSGLFEDCNATSSEPSSTSRDKTLTWNNHGRYEARWVHLQVSGQKCVFLRDLDSLYLPVAHAEGKFVGANDNVLSKMSESEQLALRYCEPAQSVTDETLEFPANPNGADHNVAGLCDSSGRVFGLMPHPERFVDPTHHPRWTRLKSDVRPDGRAIFDNAVSFFA